jgi:hypothetical protein
MAVVDAIGREGSDRAAVAIKQGLDLPAVIDVLSCQLGSGDLARVGVRGEMQLASLPPLPAAMPLRSRALLEPLRF